MSRNIQIKCENTNQSKEFPLGTTLIDVANYFIPNPKFPILGARVNNKVKGLDYDIFKPKNIKFIDITDPDGKAMYQRSLTFVFVKAIEDKYPNAVASIKNSISKGLYCEIEYLNDNLSDEIIKEIKNNMQKIVSDDLPFIRKEIETQEAIRVFEENKLFQNAKLFKTRSLLYTSVHYLGNTVGYFYGAMVPSTGYLKVFDLVKYKRGILLRFPKSNKPEQVEDMVSQDQMYKVFKEHKKGAKIIGVESIGNLNETVLNGNISEIIKISEALHEKKIANIADEIYKRSDKVRLILISGPSSSGKTSTCKRLAIQLRVIGLKPILISLDDYFVDREKTPRDEKGDYNYECIEAIDVKLFNENLLALMKGEELYLPRYDFTTGKRCQHEIPTKISEKGVIIVEGIHGLNPALTAMIPKEMKFKVYVSALTQVAIDNHNRIPTTDNRLIRRMVRDYKYRKYSALETLKRWQSVRHGEDMYIFPFQEEADAMFNSALIYELGVLKKYAEPILDSVQENCPEFSEAKRLQKFLSYFLTINKDEEIPPTSILREFLGGSSFKY